MPLDSSKIAELWSGGRSRRTGTGMSGRASKSKSKRGAFYVTQDNEVVRGNPNADNRGTFQGKQGTLRRSNKGRTYRAPNGSRRYITDWDNTVVAYLP